MESEEKEIAEKQTIGEKMENDSRFAGMVMFSGIPPKTHMTKRLFTFLPMKGAEAAYEAALKFVSDKREHPFLTLAGKPGTGKSHLAIGIGWHWLEVMDKVVKYSQVEGLLDELRSGFNTRSAQEDRDFDMKLKRIKECGLLILDDLGVEQSSVWARAKLDEIIDYRYLNELPLVVTTNMSPNKLEPRIASRLQEGVSIHLECKDYRGIIADRREERKDD